jgi:acyl transferase domain-containing protein/acyl carrier protein
MRTDRDIEAALCLMAAGLLGCGAEEVDPEASLGSLGLDSLGYVNLAALSSQRFGVAVKPDLLFEHASIRQTAAYLAGQAGAPAPERRPAPEAPKAPETRADDIAIVGAALRLPGADSLDQLAELVASGACVLGPVPQQRWMPDPAFPEGLTAGTLDRIDGFDAAFFGISPREALAMDPQQRLLMECAWHAFENAGYGPERLSGSATGVYVGASSSDYYELLLKSGAGRLSHLGTGVSHAILANRISQHYNLRGASEAVDTACSSALVALCRAAAALRRGEADMALVAGVNLFASPTPFKAFAEAGMLSASGRCLPFDAEASGYVRGEGVACVLLKPAAAALADGDRILALIKGGAVAHSGRTQSLTAPSPEAQAAVIAAALKDAGAEPGSVAYIEAHGTGTSLGDPIEFRGLSRAYARPAGTPPAYLGSLKAQIGHLEAAAGLAGLLKALVCLERRLIPPNGHLNQANPLIEPAASGLAIAAEGRAWEGPEFPQPQRRAGVSAFGFGGTNAHVVLEQAPERPARRADLGIRLFLLSARRADDLARLSLALAGQLRGLAFATLEAEAAYLDDLAYTLRRARSGAAQRLAAVARDRAELAGQLERYGRGERGLAGLRSGQAGRSAPEFQGTARDWRAAAEAWTQGAAVDWTALLPRGQARIVALPPYPFVRESFWPGLRPEAPQAAAPSGGAEPAAYAFWTQRWEPAAAPEPAALPEGRVEILVAGRRGEALALPLAQALPGNALRILRVQDKTEAESADGGALAAWIDLAALDEDASANLDAARRLEFVRARIGRSLKRGQPLRALQATLGLQGPEGEGGSPASLAGAALSGLYENLGAEYRRCLSKTVDLADGRFDAEAAAARLALELGCHDGHRAVAYRGGRRWARVLARQEPAETATAEAGLEGATALITGGTGAIGLELARRLAEQGARALLLTGRREPGAQARAALSAIEARGTAIGLHLGELDGSGGFAAALQDFRAAHGGLSHVFHCAGAADAETPAFYQKSAESMERVFAPKVRALAALEPLLAEAPPQACVLFSSAAAIVPALAAGALDYAAANRYLDLYAQQRRARGWDSLVSVNWPRWRGLGLARHARKGGDGDGGLPADQCFDALFRLLGGGRIPAGVAVLEAGQEPGERPAPPPPAASEPAPAGRPAHPPADPPADPSAIQAKLRQLVAQELETPEARLDDQASFEQLGIDSIVLMGLVAALEKWLGREVDPEALIRCDSIEAAARYLGQRQPGARPAEPAEPAAVPAVAAPANSDGQSLPPRPAAAERRVAVVGMACRFPGAPDLVRFWRNLEGGVDSVGPVPPSRFDAGRLLAEGRIASGCGGFIDGFERVRPGLFGMSAEEAAEVDPLIRLFTECSLAAAMDTAGGAEALRGRRVGVFAGARASRYAERIARPGKRSVTGVGQNFVAAYAAHLLDWRGPALVVDSACSSSLAAIHLACRSLQAGDCELAVAGGVEVLLDEAPYLFLSASQALSPDGRCRPFSDRANGFVPGEGVGCVVLKPLDRALADGDPIYAVVEGGAMNNDGHTLGITTPGADGQADAIARALADAGVRPRDLSYVEAHGTGTLIGDPIELQSLARAFGGDPPQRCAVGSVKSNIGHLLSAAGAASFIKVALALHYRALPPTLHCQRVNPRFEFDRTPFYPVRRAAPWEAGTGPLRAGISAFGFGKTNVHLVLAERPEQAPAARPGVAPALPPALAGAAVEAWLPPAARPQPDSPGGRLLALEEVAVDGGPLLLEDAA